MASDSSLPDSDRAGSVAVRSERTGFRVRRQQLSHIVLRRDEPFAQLVVPAHKDASNRRTLRAILRQVGIAVEEFIELLR